MRRTLVLFQLAFVLCELSAQSDHLKPDADNRALFVKMEAGQLKEIDSLYVAGTGTGREFINGRIYIPYYTRAGKKPLLFNGKEIISSLVYKDRFFSNIPLQYDTYLDQVIYGDTSIIFNDVISKIALNAGNISRFTLYADHDTLVITHFSEESGRGFNLEKGFYESVYNGRSEFIIRHKSILYKQNGIDEYSYIPESYIRVGDKFVKITSKRQFVTLFGKASDRVKHFIKEKGIRIRKADKHQIADILRFYEKSEAVNR